MDLAIKKAKEVGIGWVTCTGQKNSHTFIHHNSHELMPLLHVNYIFLLIIIINQCSVQVHTMLCINDHSAASNHYGIAGYYSMRAMQQGLIVSLNKESKCFLIPPSVKCFFCAIGNEHYQYFAYWCAYTIQGGEWL